ncbi:hypothetical protein ACFQZJ_08905 [Maribacter chungangensis]|uniref:Uncharacterized protein n=1 Tax=Maribacter chungangensis TaxID=1069117 RepID=A0ABW3B3E9_9FLAO
MNYAIIRTSTLNNKRDKGKIVLVEHLNKQGKFSRADVA